ncbi:MAG TPA: hypothetical protein HA362_06345 [Nanoarchaeota archaeon]|nr:hypothetical protein [Nanoarchaeota archaeon]
MNAFEQIRENAEMPALVRAVIAGEHASPKALAIEDYTEFKKMYLNNHYETIRQMNLFIGGMKDFETMQGHISAALGLECLVEEEDLAENTASNSEIKSGIPGFVSQGYTALWNDPQETGRAGEKVFVDKRSISRTLWIAKALAIQNNNDDRKALEAIAGFMRGLLKYDKEFAAKVAKENHDKIVPIGLYDTAGKAVCRQQALFCQLGLQEAGIPVRMALGTCIPKAEPHMWDIAAVTGKIALVDIASEKRHVIYGASLDECNEQAKQDGKEYIYIPRSQHFFRYSAGGLR